jgi:putative membrane protein
MLLRSRHVVRTPWRVGVRAVFCSVNGMGGAGTFMRQKTPFQAEWNTMRTRNSLFVLGLAAVMSVASVGCTDNDRDTKSDGDMKSAHKEMAADAIGGRFSERDRAFILKAANGGMYEVQSSELAMTRATNANVKAFARQMVKDHTAVNTELMGIVTRKGGTPPASLDAEHQKMIDALRTADSSGFDDLYKQQQTKAHDRSIHVFEVATKENVDDGDLRAFAAKNLPVLKMHKDMIKNDMKMPGATNM